MICSQDFLDFILFFVLYFLSQWTYSSHPFIKSQNTTSMYPVHSCSRSNLKMGWFPSGHIFVLMQYLHLVALSLLTPVSLTLLIDLIVYYGVLHHMLLSPELTHFPVTTDGWIWYIPHNGWVLLINLTMTLQCCNIVPCSHCKLKLTSTYAN